MTDRAGARGAAIGVDIGGTKMFGVVLDDAGEVVAEERAPTPQGDEPDHPPGRDVADAVAALVASLRARTGRAEGGVLPVGVGAPGMVDRDGRLRFAPNLPAAAGADLRLLIAERVGPAKVRVENDANCAALAEQRFGALRGVEEGLMVTLGTGIGGALVVGGQVRLGAVGFAAEIGHMIVDPSGPPCPCGRRGCWERYASGGGLGRLAREAAYAGRLAHVVASVGGDPESVHGEDVTTAAAGGDAAALGVFQELGWWLALGLANLVAVVDPERCVVGGGLAGAGEHLLAPARRAFEDLVEGGNARPRVDIVPAELGERAGAIGAAWAVGGDDPW